MATPPEEDRARATGDLHNKFREDRSSGCRDIFSDRQTDRQTDRNIPLAYQGRVIIVVVVVVVVVVAVVAVAVVISVHCMLVQYILRQFCPPVCLSITTLFQKNQTFIITSRKLL